MKEWECYATKYNEESKSWYEYCDKYNIPYQRLTPIPPPLNWRIRKWLYDTCKKIILTITGGIKNVINTSVKEEEYYRR